MTLRTISLLIPLLAAAGGTAQSVSPEVFSTAGGHGSAGDDQISWTIGEPVTATVAAGANTLTQGFQQPWADISTGEDGVIANGPSITVYPNPTRHILNLVYDEVPGKDRFELRDAEGRLVHTDRVVATQTVLDMETYATGMYVLRLFGADENVLRTFKITINH